MSKMLKFDEDFDLMIEEVLKSYPVYVKADKNAADAYNKLIEQSPENKSLILEFDSSYYFREVMAVEIAYDKGFRDGIRTIVQAVMSGSNPIGINVNEQEV